MCTAYLDRLFKLPVEKKKRIGTFKLEQLMMEKVKQEVSYIKSTFATVSARSAAAQRGPPLRCRRMSTYHHARGRPAGAAAGAAGELHVRIH